MFKFIKHSEKKNIFKNSNWFSATRGTSNFHAFTQKMQPMWFSCLALFLRYKRRAFFYIQDVPINTGV